MFGELKILQLKVIVFIFKNILNKIIVFLTCYHDNYFKYFMLVPQWFCQQGEGFQSINQSV
jgi:hypothetical protein